MGYRFLEDVATADVAFEALGETLEELFKNAVFALLETMVDRDTVNKKLTRRITLQNSNLEELLYDVLEHIIFLKDSEHIIFSEVDIKIRENQTYYLEATLYGDEINPETQQLRNDVKAVTYHMFEVNKIGTQYIAHIILDI